MVKLKQQRITISFLFLSAERYCKVKTQESRLVLVKGFLPLKGKENNKAARMAKDNRHSRKLRDDETIKPKKRVAAKQDATPGPISRPSDAFTLRRSSRKISSSKQTKENQTSTRKSKRLEEQKPSATPPINDSFIFTNEDLCSARMAKDNRRSHKLKDDETIKPMKRVAKPSDAKRLEEQKPSATPINDSSIFANEEDLCCLQKQKLNFVPEAELLLEAPMVVGNFSKNGLVIKELSGNDDVGCKRKKNANITEPVPSASGTEGGEIAGACRGVSSVPSHDGSQSSPGNSLWCDADCDETSLQSLLKLNICKLYEVLSLSCWIGSALLKHKLDRRQSVALTKKHLNFICNEEEANSVYLKLEPAREMFLRHMENQKKSDMSKDPIRASQATSTWSSNPQDVKVENVMVFFSGSEHVDQDSSKRTPTLSRNQMEGECPDKVVQPSSRSSVDHVVDVAISSVPADGSHCGKDGNDISPNDVEGNLGSVGIGSLAVGCNQTDASKSLSEIQNDSIQGHPSSSKEINNLRSINVGKDDLITSEDSSLHLVGESCFSLSANPSVADNQSDIPPACKPVTLSAATPPAPEAHNPSQNPEAPPQVLENTRDVSSEAATPPGPLLEKLPCEPRIILSNLTKQLSKLKLKSDYDKEFAEMVAQLNLKYDAKHQLEEAAFQSKMKQVEASRFKCQDVSSFDSMGRQGVAQVHQFLGKPSSGVTLSSPAQSSGSQQVTRLQPPLHQEPVVGLANKDKQILSQHKVCSVDGNKLVCDDVQNQQEKHHNSKTCLPCEETHETFISEQIDGSPGEEVVGSSCRVIGVSKPNSNLTDACGLDCVLRKQDMTKTDQLKSDVVSKRIKVDNQTRNGKRKFDGIVDNQQPTTSIEEATQSENAGLSSSAKKQSMKETFVSLPTDLQMHAKSDGNTFLKDRPAHLLDHHPTGTKGSLEPKTGAESIKDPCKQPSAMDRFDKNLFFFFLRIKRRVQWSEEEEEMLKEGVERFSVLTHKNLPWKKILKFGHHVFDASRNASHLKDKWRNMLPGYMAKDNRRNRRKLRDDETIKPKKRVAKQDTTPGPVSRPSDARRSSRKTSSTKQTTENLTSTRKSKRLEEQKPSATPPPPINDSSSFTNEDSSLHVNVVGESCANPSVAENQSPACDTLPAPEALHNPPEAPPQVLENTTDASSEAAATPLEAQLERLPCEPKDDLIKSLKAIRHHFSPLLLETEMSVLLILWKDKELLECISFRETFLFRKPTGYGAAATASPEPVVGLANKDKQILSQHKVCSVDGNKLVCDDVQNQHEKHHNSKTCLPCEETHETFVSEQIDGSPGEEVVGVSKPNSNVVSKRIKVDNQTRNGKRSLEPKTGAESIKDPCKQPSAMDRRIKRRVQWSEEEEEMLKEGVERFSGLTRINLPWKKILEFGHHVFDASRNASHLKDKWRNMAK
ncbi:hypothetical protein OSB04_022729 [Centaurea solstitialis]|uniref:Myb-like domain-containing protein n=1 Tax=Centaurea solstitialis TaxID=347529 RepID=A0AA38VYW4_9ASTR|nr:hypothetical protein OSB04_022729 [Centaurea solstitialis]